VREITPLFFAACLTAAALLVFCKGSSGDASSDSDGGADGGGFVCPDSGISKGPWTVAITESGIKIRWEACTTGTDADVWITGDDGKMSTVAAVETPFVVNNTYGAPLAPKAPKDWAGTYYMHEAQLTSLSPSTCYSYTLAQDTTATGRFCTSKKAGDAFRFLVIGDTNPTLGPHTTDLESHLMPMKPDFTLHGGDIQYYDSTLETWAAWFPLMAPLLRGGAIQVAIGNHESEKPDEYAQYTVRFFGGAGQDGADDHYRFESGGIWFHTINTENPVDPSSEQGMWLTSILADSAKKPGFRASVVYFHKPFLTCGDTGDDTAAEAYYAPLFVKYKVAIVFQAHMHGYERFVKDGLTWVTAAGGGGAINDPSMNTSRDYCNTRVAVGDYYNATIVDVSASPSANGVAGAPDAGGADGGDGGAPAPNGTMTGHTYDTTGAVRDTFTIPLP
jgi:hypothetical protein